MCMCGIAASMCLCCDQCQAMQVNKPVQVNNKLQAVCGAAPNQFLDWTTASLIAGGMLFITVGMSTRPCDGSTQQLLKLRITMRTFKLVADRRPGTAAVWMPRLWS